MIDQSVPTVIHIGFPKAASTTLQFGVFDRHPDILYASPYSLGRDVWEPVNGLVHDDRQYYDEAACRDLLKKLSHEAAEQEKSLVLSNEYFVRGHFRSFVPDRMSALLPHARVLVVIRNQIDLLSSFYAAVGRYLDRVDVPAPYKGKYVAFEDWLEFQLEHYNTSILGAADYDTTVRLYEETFGHDNIDVVMFEDLRRDAAAFARQIADSVSADATAMTDLLTRSHENPRVSSRLVLYHRLRDRFFPKPLRAALPNAAVAPAKRFLSAGKPYKHVMPDDARKSLSELYRDGNRAFAERFNLPLAERGYPV